MTQMNPKQAEVWTAIMPESTGKGTRPVIIMSNSPPNWDNVVVVPVTSKDRGVKLPEDCGIKRESYAAWYQVTTLSKTVLGRRLGVLNGGCYGEVASELSKYIQKKGVN